MKHFFRVTFTLMILGLLVLCIYAPWTQPGMPGADRHETIGYAPIWSSTYSQASGAHVDWNGAFALYAGLIVFFSIVAGGIAYFFREQRGGNRHHKHHAKSR